MNRFTVTKGTLSGARATSKTDSSASVVAGTEGTTLGYDKLGQRRVADYTFKGALIHEVYGYSQDGYLQTIAQGGTLKDVRVLDALGRTNEQHDKQNQTLTVSTYDGDNRLLSQRYTDAKDGNKNNTTAYSYYTDTSNTGSSQAGAGALAKTVTTPDSGSATTTTYSYDYWDEAKQKSIVKSGVTTGSTTLSYNANGHLLSAFDAAAKLTTSYFNSANGLILKRERQQVNGSGVAKVGSHFYYYADGKRVGDVSDDPNDDPRLSYAEALARKAQDPQDKKDLYKNFKPVTSADFDQNYEPINDSYPGAVGGTYTVRGGETLQAVAQTLWGDGSQWYLIAEANGLIGLETLTEGQVLVIPNKVTNIHNNSGTVRPYSAGEAIGNIDPTLPAPPPPPKHGCGGLGMVLMIVVAVVVTVYTAGAASTLLAGGSLGGVGATMSAGMTVLGGGAGFGAAALSSAAIGGAVGSIAGQGVAIASGLQDHFSWKQVGQSALGSAITAGIGSAAQAGGTLSALNGTQAWQAAGRAALSSGVTQALHGDWSWKQIVVSAVGAGAGAAAGNALYGSALGNAMGSVGRSIAAGFVGGVAGQWAGPGGKANYGSTFASTLGSVLGDEIAGGLASDRNPSNRNYRNEMDRESDNYSPVFNYNYRNGSDVESDLASADRQRRDALYGLAAAGPV
ncbi:MAG TPA: LysM peptidoglycan-binding domain-containing protein, partial [Burkholderiaceae bacterium]|nr:LysM peptidoglycan-binding domain-containing protein [Burkholderiaceae bacterium]